MFANFTATTRFDRKNDQRLTEVIEAVAELFDKQKRPKIYKAAQLLADSNVLNGQTQQRDPPLTVPGTQPLRLASACLPV